MSADRNHIAKSRRIPLTARVCATILPVLLLGSSQPAAAFDGHTITEGPLTVSIAEINGVTQLDTPYDVVVTLTNAGSSSLSVQLRMMVIDEWYPVGDAARTVTVNANKTATTTFRIAAGRGALSALYPVHVYADFSTAGQSTTAHAVRVFETSFASPPKPTVAPSVVPPDLPVNTLLPDSTLLLWTLRTHRVAWGYSGQPLQYMPVGWMQDWWEGVGLKTGFEEKTLGTTKQAIFLRPPFWHEGGTVFVEYRIKLPVTTPIKLTFANAVDVSSDTGGTLFRVWVDNSMLFSRQVTSQQWLDGQVDLSAYAGQTILLRLESHPGWDDGGDRSFWGEPTVVAGYPPQPLSESEREQLRIAAREQVRTGMGSGHLFSLDGGYRAVVAQARTRIADTIIAIGNPTACVTFDGVRIEVLNQATACGAVTWCTEGSRLVATQPMLVQGEPEDLSVGFWPDRSGLRIKIDCPERITDFALGRADQKAPRVYYGHGYCIIEPRPFQAGYGGGDLSTSHVGFDFEKGLSLLVACDYPPDYLQVDPDNHTYALHTHLNAMMTLVPSVQGAFDCARKYHPLYDKRASPGFLRKAGRFVVDLWQRPATLVMQDMQRLIDFGLTDSILIRHNWYGEKIDELYPEPYPPNAGAGTVGEVRRIVQICAEHDIPCALHDQYVYYSPTAPAFSFEHACFDEHGKPWLVADGQQYVLQPGQVASFLEGNLSVIKSRIGRPAYFLDVFANAPFEYYDRQGNFHSMLETRKYWGEAFSLARNYLGSDALTISEGGDDDLVGYLDGADCNFFRLTPEGGEHTIQLECSDWERVPWYDSVLHDRFSLHGAGYTGRYASGRTPEHHGIESDDYLSAEILTGHPMMTDYRGLGRAAVHKYWLAQDFIRSIAFDTITNVEFAGRDIHRQIIDWASGARVYVNRGTDDWQVAGKVLPQYGYYAKNGDIESGLERIGMIIIDQSRSPSRWFFNARGSGPGDVLAIRPQAESVQYLGDRRFKLSTTWQVYEAPPKDMPVSIDIRSADDAITFGGGGSPIPPTSQWAGTLRLGDDWVITAPPECRPGEYAVAVSLYDPLESREWRVMGANSRADSPVGTLVVEGSGDRIDNVRLIKAPPDPEPCRWNIERVPVDFGPAITEGAFRCEKKENTLIVTPMLYFAPFSVTLRLQQFGVPTTVRSVAAVDVNGTPTRIVGFTKTGDTLRFQTQRDEFAYVISEDLITLPTPPVAPIQVDPNLPVNAVSPNSSVGLWTLRTHRVAWSYINTATGFASQPLQHLPVGWMSNLDAAGMRTGFVTVSLGTSKPAIFLRPPWTPTPGTVFVEYQLALPTTTPIKLNFANGVNVNDEGDGILFRVWVGDKALFERQTGSHAWVNGEADLSAYAGQTILLRLESHPGPALNVRDDRSYWAEPTVVAGNPSSGSRR